VWDRTERNGIDRGGSKEKAGQDYEEWQVTSMELTGTFIIEE